jgi:hypothetical protein
MSSTISTPGISPAEGLDYEICFGSGDNFKVSMVWDSQEQLDALGARLGPILAELGIDLASPRSSRSTTSLSGRRPGDGGPAPPAVWNEGDVIHLGPDKPGWRILRIAPALEDSPYSGLFMVEHTESR